MTDKELLAMYHTTPGYMALEQLERVKAWYENYSKLTGLFSEATGNTAYGMTLLSILDGIEDNIKFKKHTPKHF